LAIRSRIVRGTVVEFVLYGWGVSGSSASTAGIRASASGMVSYDLPRFCSSRLQHLLASFPPATSVGGDKSGASPAGTCACISHDFLKGTPSCRSFPRPSACWVMLPSLWLSNVRSLVAPSRRRSRWMVWGLSGYFRLIAGGGGDLKAIASRQNRKRKSWTSSKTKTFRNPGRLRQFGPRGNRSNDERFGPANLNRIPCRHDHRSNQR